MTNQPSKESLERAVSRAVSVVAGLRNQLFGTGLDSVKIQHDIVQAFALEFDAILKNHEQDCDYLRGFNAGRREAAQQNAALVEALRPFVEHSGDFEWWNQWASEVYDNAEKVLAPYAPAKEKEKP